MQTKWVTEIQFGYKYTCNHSATVCAVLLREIIHNYLEQNSNVFAVYLMHFKLAIKFTLGNYSMCYL